MQETLLSNNWIVLAIALIAIWSLIWKGLALWKAARQTDKSWFVAILILNTLGLLEIFYVFVFSKRDQKKDNQVKVDEEKPLKKI